jgi:hypothetical protein
LLPAPVFTAQHPLRDHVCGHKPRHLRSLFHCETRVVQRSASGYRIAPSHLIFTEPALLRAAVRFDIISPIAVKSRRCRAWRSHGRHRVRKRSSRVAILFLLPAASLRVLGAATAIHASLAAAAIRACHSHGRHRVWQRSSRIAVLFLLTVASLRRVRHSSSRVAVASLGSSAPPQKRIFFAVSFFFSCFIPSVPKFEVDLWLFLIRTAVPEGTQSDPTNFRFGLAAKFAESPPRGRLL